MEEKNQALAFDKSGELQQPLHCNGLVLRGKFLEDAGASSGPWCGAGGREGKMTLTPKV